MAWYQRVVHTRRAKIAILGLILVVALLLRVQGIGFGLPYEYHVDEPQHVREAGRLLADQLDPRFWNNPPLYRYILLAEYGLLYAFGSLAGWYSSVADFSAQHAFDPTPRYLLARYTSALFGVLTVLVTWLTARAAFGTSAGLIAAWLLAISFLHVRDSHYAVNDATVTFFVALVLLAAVKIATVGERKWYVLAGTALGLGFAAKYSAALAIVAVVLAHLYAPEFRSRRLSGASLRRFLIVPGLACLVAILVSPYFVITPSRVVDDVVRHLILPGRIGYFQQIYPHGGYRFYLMSLSWGLGLGMMVLVAGGVLAAAWRRGPAEVVLAGTLVAFLLVMGRQKMYFARFLLPVVPAAIILGAGLLDAGARQIAQRAGRYGRRPRLAPILLVAAILAVSVQPLAQSLRHNHLLSREDTRTQAKRWIEENIAAGSKIAVEGTAWAPQLSQPHEPVPDSQRAYLVQSMDWDGLYARPLAWYAREGFDYLIASSYNFNVPRPDPEENSTFRAFYASLDDELDLVKAFSPYGASPEPPWIYTEIYGPAVHLWQRERPGPILKIYKLPQKATGKQPLLPPGQ